jgi:molybdopterin/thiamine biosynthesis adenylyltransferase
VASEYAVGYKKTIALKLEIDEHAPWCEFDGKGDLPLDPAELAETIEGYDLVIDCTGNFAVAAGLSTVCGDTDIALVSGALYHHGAVMRVRRQAPGDLPIADREGSDKYVSLPQQEMDANSGGFLEVGCTAPVNSSPPWAAQRLAADIAATAADFLAGRLAMPDEQVAVLVALKSSPFDVVGPVSAAGS